MSLKITMQVFCDSCGKEICRADDVKITDVAHTWGKIRNPYHRDPKLLMAVERFHKTPLTYCLQCADAPCNSPAKGAVERKAKP